MVRASTPARALGARLVFAASAGRPTLLFLLAWSFLDLMANVRYPMVEPAGWYFLPSLDVSAVLVLFAVLGLLGRRVPRPFRILLVVFFLLVRALRLGDGIKDHYFAQVFHLYTDVPMAPELLRFARATTPWWKLGLASLLAVSSAIALAVALSRALAYSASFLQRRRHVLLLAAALFPFVLVSALMPREPHPSDLRTRAFADSVLPRLRDEAEFLFNVYNQNAGTARAIAATQERLRQTPANLSRLGGNDVYLFLIESYGAAVVDWPVLAEKVIPALRAAEGDLRRAGFSLASGLLDSPTSGGMSWLAHATLLTGVRTADPLRYDLLSISKPRGLASFFHDVGYRTAFVQPNTSRPSTHAEFYGFDTTYGLSSFDYEGPTFAWAKMPDQYVLDFIRRRAIVPQHGPLFIAYALVSSHAPWSTIPTLVPDWSLLGNGAIFRDHPVLRFPTGWPDFSNAAPAYAASVLYDLEVVRSYLLKFVADDSLVIVLGDHQPHPELTQDSPSRAVPIHVLSRRASSIAPFLARGYTPGMVPGPVHAPMEDFMAEFLRDFSTERAHASLD